MKIIPKICLVLLPACAAPAFGEPPAAGGMRFRCESDRTQQHYCQVDTEQGITLVKQLSKTPCMQGRNWDYDRHGVWVSHRCRAEFVTGKSIPREDEIEGRRVRCESRGNRLQHCPAETRYGVRLTRLLSDSECVENLDWGYDETGIWTARGCRAEFRVGEADSVSPVDARSTKLLCESVDSQRKRCEVTVGKGVDLLRQLSRTRCVKGTNWDWDSTGVWVDQGCRAEFGVY